MWYMCLQYCILALLLQQSHKEMIPEACTVASVYQYKVMARIVCVRPRVAP
jgi:hypothetical protein